MIYLQLAFAFFKAGLFAVGGGLATLPFLMEMSAAHPQWFSIDELMQMVAVSESTPGPIGVNMASYVGFHVAGIPGAVTATLSLILPAFITILIVVRVLDRFQTNRHIAGGMEAMRPRRYRPDRRRRLYRAQVRAVYSAGRRNGLPLDRAASVYRAVRPAVNQTTQAHSPHRIHRRGRGAGRAFTAIAKPPVILVILDCAPSLWYSAYGRFGQISIGTRHETLH